jgi:hypothetical protein
MLLDEGNIILIFVSLRLIQEYRRKKLGQRNQQNKKNMNVRK